MAGLRTRLRYYSLLLTIASLCVLTTVPCGFARDTPHWIRVSSAHFAVLTDADEAKGHEAVVRLEQMRQAFGDLLSRNAVRMPEPLNVIAFKTDEEYAKVAPAGAPAAGFFLPGEDRYYIVLNLAQPESWRAVSYRFAEMLMNGNYPPALPWFDDGFAEYFASIRPGEKQSTIGDDPKSGALTTLLDAGHWLPVADLFAQRNTPSPERDISVNQLRAQSWITMHYLINQDKLSETGTYLGLVEMQKLPVDQAIQKAYGMSPAQLDQAVKVYFDSIAPKLRAKQPAAKAPNVGDAGNIGSSTESVPIGEAQALIAEMEIRIPEQRDRAVRDLNGILNDPKLENAIAHRAIAWDYIQKGEFDQASNELNEALRLDPKDPWVHYYFCWTKYKAAQASNKPMRGLPNMMQDLRIVLDWDPEFAEAYNLLGLARLQGGGVNAAMESMHAAIQLGPRKEGYLLNMADIYLEGKKWDAATAMLERLQGSANAQIATAAKQRLVDLPSLKKYGRVTQPETPTTTATAETPSSDSSEVEVSNEQALPPPPDKRPVKYAKGKLVSVDCTQPPAAILTLMVGGKKLLLRTEDYKASVVIGADELSCAWTNRAVTVNYKAGGKADGDLVSVEIE